MYSQSRGGVIEAQTRREKLYSTKNINIKTNPKFLIPQAPDLFYDVPTTVQILFIYLFILITLYYFVKFIELNIP